MAENSFDPNRQASTPSPDLASAPQQSRPTEPELDEEERRRAGRGGGDINPADASHSLNIRPDVGHGPAGLEVYTTMKSMDYQANLDAPPDHAEVPAMGADERTVPSFERSENRNAQTQDGGTTVPSADEFENDLAAARGRGSEGDPQRDESFRRASEESTKRQEAERAARSGEDVPGQGAASEADSFVADLRAAWDAARREQEGERREVAFDRQGDSGQAAPQRPGPGLF